MNELVGRTITGIELSRDGQYLRFSTNTGPIVYRADGDCCSESWFADIIGVSELIGQRVTAVSTVDMDGYSVDDGRCRQEFDKAYGFKIATARGVCDIVFRNSSNGYYGGDLEKVDAVDKDTVMTPITSDYPNADEMAFLRAIAAKPQDSLPKLLFADWLQDRGRDEESQHFRYAAKQLIDA